MAETRLSGPRFPLTFSDGQALTAAELNALQNGLLDVIRKHTHGSVDGPAQITAGAIAPGAVNETHLAYNAVRKGHIVTGAVGRSELRYGAVQEQHLDELAVTTAKVKDQQITEAKLAPQVQAKLNAPRDGASTFGYCAWMDGNLGYVPELGKELWSHWLFDKVSITYARLLNVQRQQQDGTWGTAERVEPERIKVLSRTEMAQRILRLFQFKGYRSYQIPFYSLAIQDGQYTINSDEVGQRFSCTADEMVLYIHRFKELMKKDYGNIVQLIGLRQLGEGLEAAVVAALPPHPHYPQYVPTRAEYDGLWLIHYTAAPKQTTQIQMSTQELINVILGSTGDPTSIRADAIRTLDTREEPGGTLPRELAPLNLLVPVHDTTSAANIGNLLQQYFNHQWIFAPSSMPVISVTPTAPYDYHDWIIQLGDPTESITDEQLKGILRRYVGDADPYALHLFDLMPYLEPRPTSTPPPPPLPPAPAPLPGEGADRTGVRLTADPATIHWAIATRQTNVFSPGIKGNSAFTENGQPVVFTENATLTSAQAKTALRILDHFGVALKTGWTAQSLMQNRHTVRFFNNPHLIPAGYWTGTTRNIRSVMRMTLPMADSAPLPFVRVVFETPYHDSTYAVSVTTDMAPELYAVTPAVLARTKEYVDLVFFGPTGQVDKPAFTLTINGELNHP